MRILVVEDEKEISDGISLVLNKAGYQVDCVYDGLLGLDYIFSEIYDLILLDIMLPKINGLDIVKNIRAEGVDTPIILLTAKSQIEDDSFNGTIITWWLGIIVLLIFISLKKYDLNHRYTIGYDIFLFFVLRLSIL